MSNNLCYSHISVIFITPNIKNHFRPVLSGFVFAITDFMYRKNAFSPSKTVKRAEVCQMFYNMKW